ncbi:hypothetical protein TRFO_19101 [Tritrichomonas foetus]|uniref:START domain-containing protein n=1 Tax=Tritrichomonas foetus TaxID=1144522 RepID=A0A1J4KPV6_9EUKA|nr:hypothetical protein TRFO_19101 [Tritrichomonas foetus]|eukprot:OHT11461.1 hypothetical protein TRFO_19101 [Tritrichomonas foetus]
MKKVDLTAEQKASFDKIADETLEKTISILADKASFKEEKKDGPINFYTRSEKGSSFSQVLSSTSIPVPVERVLEELKKVEIIDPSMDKKLRDDTLYQELYVLDESDSFHDGFVYCALDTPTRLVSKRDFLMYRKHYERDGVHYFVHVSVDYQGVRPVTKEYVRGKILLQIDILDADPENEGAARLRFLVHADPAGSIPAWVYNMTAISQGYAVKKVRDRLV